MQRRATPTEVSLRRAVHLASEPVSGELVDRWLASADVAVCRYACAYALCADLSARVLSPPQLILVGTDLLDDEELPVVDYIRRGWPAVPLVLYGRRGPVSAGGWVRHLETRAALRAALRASPAELVRAMIEARRHAGAVLRQASRAEQQVPSARRATTRPVPSASSGVAADKGDVEPPITPSLPLRSLLTPEELAALLEGPARED